MTHMNPMPDSKCNQFLVLYYSYVEIHSTIIVTKMKGRARWNKPTEQNGMMGKKLRSHNCRIPKAAPSIDQDSRCSFTIEDRTESDWKI